jgi:hypothetical protein
MKAFITGGMYSRHPVWPLARSLAPSARGAPLQWAGNVHKNIRRGLRVVTNQRTAYL